MGGLQRAFQRRWWGDSGLKGGGLSFQQFRGTVQRSAEKPRPRKRWREFWRVALAGTLKPSLRSGLKLRTWINLARLEYLDTGFFGNKTRQRKA